MDVERDETRGEIYFTGFVSKNGRPGPRGISRVKGRRFARNRTLLGSLAFETARISKSSENRGYRTFHSSSSSLRTLLESSVNRLERSRSFEALVSRTERVRAETHSRVHLLRKKSRSGNRRARSTRTRVAQVRGDSAPRVTKGWRRLGRGNGRVRRTQRASQYRNYRIAGGRRCRVSNRSNRVALSPSDLSLRTTRPSRRIGKNQSRSRRWSNVARDI